MGLDPLAELLKRCRQERGFTQQQLAATAAVPLTSLQNYEQAHRRPDLATAYRLARALGVDLVVLGEAADRGQQEGEKLPERQTGKRK